MHFYEALRRCISLGHAIRRKGWPRNLHIVYGKHKGDMGDNQLFSVSGDSIKAGNALRYHFEQVEILANDWESKPCRK